MQQPFGVATEGRLVPVLIATAKWVKLVTSDDAFNQCSFSLRWNYEAVPTNTLLWNHLPMTRYRGYAWRVRAVRLYLQREVLHLITIAIVPGRWLQQRLRKDSKKEANGSASSKALPIECSSITPVNAVAKMITEGQSNQLQRREAQGQQ